MSAPLYEHLKKYINENRISFAMPGHKNGRGLKDDLVSLDVTELDATEDLHNPHEHIKKSQALLSKLYGSDSSYILTGGSTAAIQCMICAAVSPGGTLLADSKCHMSVLNTCALLGINIRFFSVPNLEGTLNEDVDAVMITSPDYYGVCADVRKMAEECHKKNIPLLVDEAHGAHFAAEERLPETAVKYADAVCHSAHKTLNALNGAAYLHVNGSRINIGRLERALSMFQSSSPSYVIAASADTAREEIENGGGWRSVYDMCVAFRKRLRKIDIKTLDNDDVTRIVLDFSDFELTGFMAEEILGENGIDVEMADLTRVVLIVTPSNTQEDLDALFEALGKIVKNTNRRRHTLEIAPPPECIETILPQKAFFAEWTEVDLKDAKGCVSCISVTPYPPGIPVIRMGETIRKEQIEYIEALTRAGAQIRGIENGKIMVTKV